jgi:hypothetical protein
VSGPRRIAYRAGVARRRRLALVSGATVRTHLFLLALIAGVACFLYSALFSRDPLTTHEGLDLYFRTHEYLKELGNGHWVPQLLPGAVRGAGSAFPTFYPPLAYLVASLLSFVTGDLVRGVNLALLLSVVLSGWSMYFMGVVVTRNRLAAVVAAVLYLSFPYRLVDVFVRGALAESWSFVWFPLIVAGTWRAIADRRTPWYLPVAWAGLVLTHLPTALYFGFPYGILLLLGLWREGWRVAAGLAAAFVLALGLTAWFLVPQQSMLGDVGASSATALHADTAFVQLGRVSPGKLLGDWRNGWRGPDRDFILPNGTACPRIYCGRSFVLGTGHLAMLALVAVSAAVLLRGWARRRRVPDEQRTRIWFVVALLVAYVFNLAFVINPRTFLRFLPGTFGYIQYPWRLVGVLAFLAATIVAVVIASHLLPRWVTGCALAFTAVVAVIVPTVQREPAFYRGVDERDIARLLPSRGDRGFTVEGEYLPKHVNPYDIGPYLIDAPQVRGNGRVVRWHRGGGDVAVDVDLRADSTVVFPLLYYDVYRVTAAGRGRLQTFSSRGLLAARVPAGSSALHVSHGLTLAGRLGAVVTLLALLLLTTAVVLRRRREAPMVEAGVTVPADTGSSPAPVARAHL